jgi:cytochrome c2
MRAWIAVPLLATLVTSCTPDALNSPAAFRLPNGDAEAGRKTFVELRCYVCHEVKGVDEKFDGTPAAHVVLGGKVTRVKSYAELVTAIINPTHKIPSDRPGTESIGTAPSVMSVAGLNDVMTVTQLVNLVAFLQPQYQVEVPKIDPYTYRYRYYYH